MLAKIQDISKLSLIGGIILYLFGFMCISAYLSRFGIVSFDIINARFAIAGIFPLAALVAPVGVAIYVDYQIKSGEVFTKDKWVRRLLMYNLTLILLLSSSAALSRLLNEFSFSQMSVRYLEFTPLFGDGDFLGKFLQNIGHGFR